MMKSFLIAVILVTLSSCGDRSSKQSPQAQASAAKSTGSYIGNVSEVSTVNPASGNLAADFSWFDSEGKQISLSSLKGKTVLINFWATWCGPCKAELPDIEAISKEYASKGFVVVGVSEDRGDGVLKDVSSFASDNGLTYQIVVDNDNIADAYGNINAIPTSFLVKDGQIVEKWIGVRDKAFFESTARKYLD